MAETDPSTNPSPEAMASDALKSAQDAVSSLKSESQAPGAPDQASSEALAAMQAALKDINAPGAASAAPGSGAESVGSGGAAPAAFQLPSFGSPPTAAAANGIDLLADVNLNVKIELGRTRMLVEDVLRLGQGSVVELDKLAGDPVDIYVNERPVARGEVLVLNDNFCIRINEIITPQSEQPNAA